MSELIAPTFNLLVLVGILAYYLREPLKQMVRTRHSSLRDELARVKELLRQSQDQYDEFSAKLKAINAETAALRQEAEMDAHDARRRLLSDAQRLSTNITADARRAATALYDDLKSRLYTEMGAHVLSRTEALLRERLTGDDRVRIRQEFSNQVETVR